MLFQNDCISGKSFIGNILTLVDVREDDTGDVFCIAENGYSPVVSQKFQLTIHCKYISERIHCKYISEQNLHGASEEETNPKVRDLKK